MLDIDAESRACAECDADFAVRVRKIEKEGMVFEKGLAFFSVSKDDIGGPDVEILGDDTAQYGSAGNETSAVTFKDKSVRPFIFAIRQTPSQGGRAVGQVREGEPPDINRD